MLEKKKAVKKRTTQKNTSNSTASRSRRPASAARRPAPAAKRPAAPRKPSAARPAARPTAKKPASRKPSAAPRRPAGNRPVQKNQRPITQSALERRRKEQARRLDAQRRQRRRKKKWAIFSIFFLLFVVLGGVFLTTRLFFNVELVTVSGNSRYSSEDIQNTAGIQKQQNILTIPKAEIVERLKAEYPYINDVKVKFHLPTGVELAVTEEQPIAAIPTENGFSILSSSGKIIETKIAGYSNQIPQLFGFDVTDKKVGDRIIPKESVNKEELPGQKPEPDVQRFKILSRLLKTAGEEPALFLNVIDVTDIYNVCAYYGDTVKISFGSENELEYKMKGLKNLLGNQLKSFAGVIDVTDPSSISARPGQVQSPAVPVEPAEEPAENSEASKEEEENMQNSEENQS